MLFVYEGIKGIVMEPVSFKGLCMSPFLCYTHKILSPSSSIVFMLITFRLVNLTTVPPAPNKPKIKETVPEDGTHVLMPYIC